MNMRSERVRRKKEMINIDTECEYKFEFDTNKIIREVIDYGLDYLQFPYFYEINVIITDSKNIQEINNEYRNIDRPTDVLSFPMNEVEDYKSEENVWCVNPETEEVILGDIVINGDYVKKQAYEYGHSEKREIAFLVIHSLLHLLGYDHMTETEEKVMFGLQEEILENYGITR